ncbi:MAG: hypothetical protein HQ542_03100, partial [Bacteroidia bacterium]|nr:hypothetical protein [Bacteroidia bacterium]
MLKKNLRYIIAIGFFLVATTIILLSDIRFDLFPSQEVNLNGGMDFGPVLKELVFVQEVPVTKKYLTGID